MAKAEKTKVKKKVEMLTHEDASRKNIPTAEYEAVLHEKDKSSIRVAYDRRNRDLDPQLIWRGKDEQDWSDLVIHAPPLYIQEKVHPKALIDDLRRQTELSEAEAKQQDQGFMGDMFSDFNGLPDEAAKTEFYQHDANWSNRMILGDSLQVMASLAEREGLRGKVQCIYFDPPYGIKFNSNFQWSTTSRDVVDGKAGHITREPEMVKAFRDTWRDGIHSYLTYLRDRLIVARDLLGETGSIFVQIGDENVHRVRMLLDEVFGEDNGGPLILVKKKGGQKGGKLEEVNDYLLMYFKNRAKGKFRQLFDQYEDESEVAANFSMVQLENGEWSSIAKEASKDGVGNLYKFKPSLLEQKKHRLFKSENSTSGGQRRNQSMVFEFQGRDYDPGIAKGNCWKHTAVRQGGEYSGMDRMAFANRLYVGKDQIGFVRYHSDFGMQPITNWWDGFGGASDQVYVVQTNERVVSRCFLMATDPGDLVLDPTCGSGTSAYVAEQWGRRWITIDTSRVALALARSRIMGAKYPYYLLSDSPDGQAKQAEISRSQSAKQTTSGNINHGFVYHRVPHITSALIANNSEIDVIRDHFEEVLTPLQNTICKELKECWDEWEIPRVIGASWSKKAKIAHKKWMEQRQARQSAIDTSIAAKAEFEYLYDRPYEDGKKVRVPGPFTVESLSPHRALTVGVDDELVGPAHQKEELDDEQDFVRIILENLKMAGVQQAHKDEKIDFISLVPWPGDLVCAEGVYVDEIESEKRAAVFIGSEFGTVSRPDLVSAAREAADAGFDVLIACAFNYDAHSTEFEKLGRVPVLKARMNADLHMADELKNTGKGNLFVIFGEPDIDILDADDDQIQVKINGVDVFHPNTGEVRSNGADGIACWFIDSDYNEESFFVRHAYFLGANDPYRSLKKTLKAEINREAWESLNSDTSRPFEKPKNGRIAVKVINHLGDEVMKVYKV